MPDVKPVGLDAELGKLNALNEALVAFLKKEDGEPSSGDQRFHGGDAFAESDQKKVEALEKTCQNMKEDLEALIMDITRKGVLYNNRFAASRVLRGHLFR